MIKTTDIAYRDGDTELSGFAAWDDSIDGPRPCVLISHAFRGQGDFEREKAEKFAELGWVGFALDNYGGRTFTDDRQEARALMQPLAEDRKALRRRLAAGLAAARALDVVDDGRVAAIGFCFGGMCVLELARSGADVRGVASFHGTLDTPFPAEADAVDAEVRVYHGYEDPAAPPEKLAAFMAEMSECGADWQLHAYGKTYHAFTHPGVNMPEHGLAYNPLADAHSWKDMVDAFERLFE